MLIYRGAGFMTLFTPIVTVLLLMWLFPDPSVRQGNISLVQFLMGTGIGSVMNTVIGFYLNRKTYADGVHHHFFYIPMQWPALIISIVCVIIWLIKK